MLPDTERDANDAAVIVGVLHGDRDRYGEIVRRYESLVFRLSFTYLGNHEEAADATQEVFVKAFRALPSFHMDRAFLPWLYSITLNHLRSRSRKSLRLRRTEAGGDVDCLPDARERENPAEQAIDAERRALIRDGVARLPHALRKVVALYYFEGLSVEETAEALGLHVENVKTRLFRARRKLKELLIGRI